MVSFLNKGRCKLEDHVDHCLCHFRSAVTRSVCDCLPVKFNRLSRRVEYVWLEPVQSRYVWAEFWLSRLRVILNGLAGSVSLCRFWPEFGSNCILKLNSRRKLYRSFLLLVVGLVDLYLRPYAYLRDQDGFMLQASIVLESFTESAPQFVEWDHSILLRFWSVWRLGCRGEFLCVAGHVEDVLSDQLWLLLMMVLEAAVGEVLHVESSFDESLLDISFVHFISSFYK